MSSNPSTPDDPGLFDDLPLHAQKPPSKKAPAARPSKTKPPLAKTAERQAAANVAASEELRLLFQDESEEEPSSKELKLEPADAEIPPEDEIADLDLARSRLIAGLLDLGVVLSVAVIAFVCIALMGIDLSPLPWAPMALFLTAFSFLYCVFPLAFWGRTPGMASLGLRSRSLDDRSLSFGQTAWRWLAALLTVVSFGLPLLLTLKGTYLSDLLSKSKVEYSGL